MKKSAVILVVLIASIYSFTKPSLADPQIIWGSNDPAQPMRILVEGDGVIKGAAGQTLVIQGYVDVSHQDDVNDQANIDQNAKRVTLVFDHIRFRANSAISTKSDLVLTSRQTIGGVVEIRNLRGATGVAGDNGEAVGLKAPNGNNGGNSVRGANASLTNSATNGHPGGNGDAGVRGSDGQHARHGSDGGNSGSILIDINNVEPGTLFKIRANGGNGGKGGDGSRGQDGGNGGFGGKGGDGGSSNIPGRDGADGGPGGNGGDGGDGGNGGAGGNGGNGGDGGNLEFFSANQETLAYLGSSYTIIDRQLNGGKRGAPGLGGAGGTGGSGGAGGQGGGGGHGGPAGPLDDAGQPGSNGGQGKNGKNGMAGPNGRYGQHGRKGKDNIAQIQQRTQQTIIDNQLFSGQALGSNTTGIFTRMD